MCRRIATALLVCLVVGGLAPARPPASARPQVGVVTQALDAHFGTALASPGSTIFDGDSLSTGARGGIRLRVGASQFYLPGRSAVTLRALPKGTQAALSAGTMTFALTKGSDLEILANAATIRPMDGQAASAQVSIAGPKELLVYARRGSLEFSFNGESDVIPEGANYRVVLDSPDSLPAAANASSNPKPPRRPFHKPKGFFFLLLGGGAAATLWFVVKAYESPDRP